MDSGVGHLLDFTDDGDDIFPAFSRLPPDGHEFPTNYLELASNLSSTAVVTSHDLTALLITANMDAGKKSNAAEFTGSYRGSKQELMEPSFGHDNFSPIAVLSDADRKRQVHLALDDAAGELSFVSNYQLNGISDEAANCVSGAHDSPLSDYLVEQHDNEDTSLNYVDMTMPIAACRDREATNVGKLSPPIPSKRSVMAVTPSSSDKLSLKSDQMTTGKQPEKTLSVRDKIAMFAAKGDSTPMSPTVVSVTPPVTKPRPKPAAMLEDSPLEMDVNQQPSLAPPIVSNEIDSEVSIRENPDRPSTLDVCAANEESSPAAITTTNCNNGRNKSIIVRKELLLAPTTTTTTHSYLSNFSDYSLYGDRPGSSLSLSSNFSKSSDDLLSQDMDSSDMDDHPIGGSSTLDRRIYGKASSESYFQRYGPVIGNGSGSNNKNSWSTSSTDSEANEARAAAAKHQSSSVHSASNKSMYAILESRKSNVSKLKGLVIPSMQEKSMNPYTPANDLPLIFSVDSILLSKVELPRGAETTSAKSFNDKPNSSTKGVTATKTTSVLPTTNSLDQSHYSPAFRRKPFLHHSVDAESVAKSVSSSNGSQHAYASSNGSIGNGEKSQRGSPAKQSITSDTPRSAAFTLAEVDSRGTVSSSWFDGVPPPLPKTLPPDGKSRSLSSQPPSNNGYTDVTSSSVDLVLDTEDQESGISSIESPNVSMHNTPPGSPKESHHHQRRSGYNGVDEHYTATPLTTLPPSRKMSLPSSRSVWESIPTPGKRRGGSSDPDDEDDEYGEEYDDSQSLSPRVLKANSVEAINRMNVLHSSKTRNGSVTRDVGGGGGDSNSGDDSSSGASNHSDSSLRLSDHRSHSNHHHHRRQMSFDDKVILCKSDSVAVPTNLKSNLSQVLGHQRRASNENILLRGSRESTPATDVAVAVEKKKAVSDERWMELERKYGPKSACADSGSTSSLVQRDTTPITNHSKESIKPSSCESPRYLDVLTSGRASMATSVSVSRGADRIDGPSPVVPTTVVGGKNFQSLAKQWEKISVDGSNITTPVARIASPLSKSMTSVAPKSSSPRPAVADVKQVNSGSSDAIPIVDRKTSLPSNVYASRYTAAENTVVSMREKKSGSSSSSSSQMSRPTSLIETDSGKSKLREIAAFEVTAQKIGHLREKARAGEATKPRASQLLDAINSGQTGGRRSTSFNDLRQIFENQEMSIPASLSSTTTTTTSATVSGVTNGEHQLLGPKEMVNHIRMSSLDSTTSDSDFYVPAHYGSTNSLGSNLALDQYGSITSLASSTSLISPQELQQLIDEANQSLEESGTPSHEISVVVLQREIPGGSIGITLTGGADYDSKEITVNKVIIGSLADRDGRIQKGDRVLSINGKNLKGVTHREALTILKAPRTDCVLVLSRSRQNTPQDAREISVTLSRISNSTSLKSGPIKFPPSPTANTLLPSIVKAPEGAAKLLPIAGSSQVTTRIEKSAGGLGFSLEGGKDSPLGDKPLTIKKIFIGGPADKDGSLNVGDEILSVNGCDVTNMARIEAWTFMRKLPDGLVTLVVNHQA